MQPLTTLKDDAEQEALKGEFIPADRRPTRPGVLRVMLAVAMYTGPSFWDIRIPPANSPPRARR